MTARYDGFYIVLDRDLRDDDAQATITALRQIKGVISVEPHKAHTMEGITTRIRTVNEVSEKLFALIKELRDNK